MSLEVFWWNLNIENYNSNRTASVEHFDEVGDEEFYFIVHLAVFHKVFSSGEYGTQNCSGFVIFETNSIKISFNLYRLVYVYEEGDFVDSPFVGSNKKHVASIIL